MAGRAAAVTVIDTTGTAVESRHVFVRLLGWLLDVYKQRTCRICRLDLYTAQHKAGRQGTASTPLIYAHNDNMHVPVCYCVIRVNIKQDKTGNALNRAGDAGACVTPRR